MRVRRALRAVATAVLLAGWVVLLRGLYLLPVTDDPELDLEAGGRFAVNVSVYLPAIGLSMLILAAAPLAVTRRRGSIGGMVVAVVAALFAGWVFKQHALVDDRPGLEDATLLAVVLALAAFVVFLLEAGAAPRDDVPGNAPEQQGEEELSA